MPYLVELQVEATTDVITYASDSTESTVPPAKAARPQAAIDQDPTAPSQYSGPVDDLMEQVTPELSTLLTDNYHESSTMVPMHSATSDMTDFKYEASVLQERVATSLQEVTDDDESTSASEMPTEYSSTTLSSKALFSSTATDISTKDTSVSDVFSPTSILPFDLVDPSSTAASTEEQERHLLVSSASFVPKEDALSTLSMDFSTPYNAIVLEVDGKMESEKIVPSESTFSVPEWTTPEETFSGETPLLHSTVFDTLSFKDHHPEPTGITGTEDPGTAFHDQSTTKEVTSILEEESVKSSLPPQVFFSNVEPIFPMNLMDDSTSLIPDVTETPIDLSSSSPTDSITPIEETSFSIHLDVSTQTPILLDTSTATTDNDSVTPEPDSLFGKSQSEATSVTDLNETQFTEPFQEAFSDESAVPFTTTSIDVEMTDISTGDEVNLPAVSLQTTSIEKMGTIEFSPTTLQTSTESSFPTSVFDGISSTIESISISSSTNLNPNIMESSTTTRYYDSILSNPKIDTEEIQSSNDLSTPDASTVADITSTENDPSSSETNLSLELADLEGSSSVADWSSPEVFTESALPSSASTDVEMMDVQTVSSKEFAALSSATSLAEELVISKLSSISMETSTEVNFSPSISNEVFPTFEPIPHSNLADTSSTLLYNIVDLSTTNSPSEADVITAETKIMDEENEFVSSTTNSLLEDSQTNLPTDEVVSSLISFAVDENDNVDTTRSVDMSEPTESVPVSTEEGGSYTAVKELYSSTIYTSLEQTPISTNPPELTTESLTSGSVSVSEDPSLLHSTSIIVERTSSSEGYNNEVFTPSAGASSNEEFTVDELTPTDTGTSTDGSFLMADEFSGTSELPPNFVDTSPFSISAEFSTDHFNFLSGNSVTFGEDAQTAEEFQTSYLPILHEVTTSDTALLDKEDVIFSSTTSLYVEDLQSNVPTEETLSSVFPFDMSGFFEETLDPLETNPFVLLTDSPASFQSLSTLNELSGDFTSFDPSLSTMSPPISDEVKPLGTDLTTSDEELTQVSTPTQNFENEGLEDNSFLTLDEDGSGTPGFLISTDQPHETVGVTISPINLFPSSLARLEDSFTSSFASTQISDTSQPSTISDISSTDVTFDSTSFPIAVSSESIADAITSQPATHRPTLEVSTSSVLPMDYDGMVSSTTEWENIFSEGSGHFLGSSSPLVYSFVDTDPQLPYTLVNLEVTSLPEDDEGSAISAVTSSDEQFIINKSSPSILELSIEDSSSMSDEFYGTSELPQNLADTSTFFMPTELSTNHQNFVSENSVTPGANMQTLTEEKLSSSFLPTSPEITTFGTELVDMENNHVSPTTSLFLEDFQSNVTSGETLSSPISFDMLVSSSGLFEQTLTPLQTSPLVVMTDSLTTASLLNVDTSDNEDFVSFGSSTSDSLSEFQLLGADFTTPDVVIDVSTAAPISENEGSAENSILTVEDEGSGAGTPGFLDDTPQPTQTTIPEIDLTTNGPFSSPAVSIWETFHTDGTVASSVESTSARGVSDNLIGQELANDSFASMGFSETTNLSPLSSSSSEMSITSTPTTIDILSTETPSSQMPIDVTTSAGSQSTVESTTSLPSLVPNVLHLSSQSPIFDVVTVSLKPPSAYNMIASSTGVWNNTSSESPPFGSSGPSKDSLSSSPTFTTEINTPSTSTYPVNSFPVSQESVTLDEFTPSSTTSRSATLPFFSSSTMAVSTTSPDTVPSSSTNSAIVTSISPTASDIPTSTTVPPIINLWNLLIARITTANGIPFLTKNVTSISSISDGIASGSHNEELKGSSTSSMPSSTGRYKIRILLLMT